MIRRFYIHNFRCLENFELPVSGRSSVLLVGKNGAGKSTIGAALEVFQKIGRGTNRVGELIKPKDLAQGRKTSIVRFEIEVELEKMVYGYSIAFEYPEGFRELRVYAEKLSIDGKAVYSRELAKVQFTRWGANKESNFNIDWHLVALPIVQSHTGQDPVSTFRQWLGKVLILRPIPSLILGSSNEQTLQPRTDLTDIGAWFTGLISQTPAAYMRLHDYLKQVMPDLEEVSNPSVGVDARNLFVQFVFHKERLQLPFEDLSDGEKCYMICGMVLAANKSYGPLFCFWDEPDNYLAPSEVGHFVLSLRRAFQAGGQLIATSHNTEAIRRFSDETTLLIYRNSHLEPSLVRPLDDIHHNGDLISALVRDEVKP